MNKTLTITVTKEEIKEAVFSVKATKVPGPDGMTGLFFQQYWDVVWEQVTIEIQKFFEIS